MQRASKHIYLVFIKLVTLVKCKTIYLTSILKLIVCERNRPHIYIYVYMYIKRANKYMYNYTYIASDKKKNTSKSDPDSITENYTTL